MDYRVVAISVLSCTDLVNANSLDVTLNKIIILVIVTHIRGHKALVYIGSIQWLPTAPLYGYEQVLPSPSSGWSW